MKPPKCIEIKEVLNNITSVNQGNRLLEEIKNIREQTKARKPGFNSNNKTELILRKYLNDTKNLIDILKKKELLKPDNVKKIETKSVDADIKLSNPTNKEL